MECSILQAALMNYDEIFIHGKVFTALQLPESATGKELCCCCYCRCGSSVRQLVCCLANRAVLSLGGACAHMQKLDLESNKIKLFEQRA